MFTHVINIQNLSLYASYRWHYTPETAMNISKGDIRPILSSTLTLRQSHAA